MKNSILDKYLTIKPMKYYDKAEEGLSDNLKSKRNALIENKDNAFIATQKWDGYWGMFIRGESDDEMFIRGRSLNVNGGYENYAEKLPHLVEEMKSWPLNTVVLAEMCWPELGRIATDVGTVLRCLSSKAIERQKEEKIIGSIFDLLVWNGTDVSAKPYIERLKCAKELIGSFEPEFFQLTEIYENDFPYHASDIIARKGEGVVIQRKDNPYFFDKRPAWKSLKLKQKLPEIELQVIGTLEPEQFSKGDTNIDDWSYVEDGRKLTKAYANNWKAGVKVLYNGVEVSVASGMTEDDKQWLSTPEAIEAIEKGKLIAVVRAMQVNTLGSLRHPVLVRLRNDL